MKKKEKEESEISTENPNCIVKEYPGTSGHNVNDWHWTEWNAMEWLKKRADEIFKRGVKIYENKSFRIESEGVQWLKGDACVTNRKRRVGSFYELEFGINIKGTHFKTGRNYYGIIEIPYLADENQKDEFDVTIIRFDGLKNLWLKKKNRYKRLKKLIKKWLTELDEGACFKERAQESLKELDILLEKGERIVNMSNQVIQIGENPERNNIGKLPEGFVDPRSQMAKKLANMKK